MSADRFPIPDFVMALGFTEGQFAVLAVCYYGEFIEKAQSLSLQDVQDLLHSAKVPAPGNLKRDLKALVKKKMLNLRMVPATGERYAITNTGIETITVKMNAIGLTINRPTEKADILKQVSESLYILLQNIPNTNEREFIEEAVSCLSPMNNALRAAVVLAWSGTVHSLRRKIDQRGTTGYTQFNYYYRMQYPKKSVNKLNDFEDVKDSVLLEICDKMDIVKGKSVKNQLQPWLDFRNGVGHPTNVKPGIHKVKAFFEDIVQYVLAIP